MEARKNKFEYDKEYYENYNNLSIVGNTARKLDNADFDEEKYEDSYNEEIRYSYEETVLPSEEIHKPLRQPKQRVRRVIKFNFVHVTMLLITIAAFVYSSFKYLEVQSDIVQKDKEITQAEKKLSDIQAKNDEARSYLVESFDREYIYNVAVGRLGMIYPDKNQIIYYETSEEGYVRQYGSIPDIKDSDILNP